MIGPAYSKRLEKLAIFTVDDLLHHYPVRHEDLTRITAISECSVGQINTIKGTVVSAKNIFTKSGKRIQKAVIADDTGQIEATWFNQPFVVDALNKASVCYFSGKVDFFANKLSFTAPEFETFYPGKTMLHTGRLVPIYPETAGVSSKWLRSRLAPLLLHLDSLIPVDFLPAEIKRSHQLIDLAKAIQHIHFPDTNEQLAVARRRLAFDELFLLQVASQQRKLLWHSQKVARAFRIDEAKTHRFIDHLPFVLTHSQQKVWQEILTDLAKTKPMNRLLQGDVGAGKTVLAALAMLVAYQNGQKSVLLAPTTILANQHFATIKTLLEPFGVKVSLTTGHSAKSVKDSLSSTPADILVGTHALLFSTLPASIGLLVIDEQHRFGVKQRSALLAMGRSPHLLAMTATPIPRTIALTVFGELDVSVIDEMPLGRKKIKTWVVPAEKRQAAYDWIKTEITQKGGQAFIVCPFIEESVSEKLAQVKAVQAEYELLSTKVFPDLKVAYLHGRMSEKQKQQVISDFAAEKTHVLVSTPVIEVGIDIRAASIMMIEGAERFGLAQLHQLRGRVGRGDRESYCLLFTSTQNAQEKTRLQAMSEHDSGFALAEIDLKLRGPGEIFGLTQHGFTKLKVARFSDSRLVADTHQAAADLVKADPQLTGHPALADVLTTLETNVVEPN